MGACYSHRVNGKCTRRFLLWCQEYEEIIKTEVIPFDDPVGVQRFIDGDWVIKRRDMP